jgi:hypothetical protein
MSIMHLARATVVPRNVPLQDGGGAGPQRLRRVGEQRIRTSREYFTVADASPSANRPYLAYPLGRNRA